MHAAVTECGEDEVRRRLDAKYLPATPQVHHPDYQGEVNSSLDRDIEVWEVRAALHDLNTRSAAGPDRVTNKVLKNLGESAIESLTDYYNRNGAEESGRGDCGRSGGARVCAETRASAPDTQERQS
ncbi:hypothetical protein MTO96_028788 [Rhipicephalus appendiculatus]